MILVEMYTKDDCHLCETAKGIVRNVQAVHPFEFREIKIHEGDEYFESYGERIPLVFIDGEFAFQFRVPEKTLLDMLRSRSAPAT